jgi:hypothetical protein
MCEQTLGGFGGLVCTDDSGKAHTHRYEASAGPDLGAEPKHVDLEES